MTVLGIITPSAGMFNAPDQTSGRETDALYGEAVRIITSIEGWAEIVLTTDGYQAWVAEDMLGPLPQASHHINVPRALMTKEANIKSPAAGYLPMGSLIRAHPAEHGMMAVTSCDDAVIGYIVARHAMAIGTYVDDYVAVAEQMIGTPYRWGGRDSIGIDCSALVQLALAAAGVAVPRNSSDQEKTIGRDLTSLNELKRGDIVFWKGHVGIMQDHARLLHANMWHGMTASEDLREALPRLEKAAGPITRLARLG